MRDQSHESPDQRIAANVRSLRERKGISQSVLAAAMSERGIPWHQQTVGRIESGQQQLRAAELVELAAVLKTSLDRFTWSSPEASATERVYAAGHAVRMQHERIAEAVQRMLIDIAMAERALAETEDNPSPRVQEARTDTAGRLEEFGINDAIEEGVRRYNELTGAADEEEAAANG